MKHNFKIFTVIMIAIAMPLAISAQAYQFAAIVPSGQTLYFTRHSTSSGYYATVTYPSLSSFWGGYVKPTGALIIPSTIVHNGMTYTITAIKTHAFYDCKGLTTISIPNTVTDIGADAFYNVRHIEYYGNAPNGSDNWGALTKNGTIDGNFIFSDTTRTHLVSYIGTGVDITIPSTVNSIGNIAFYGCSGIETVVCPNSITTIGNEAFRQCSSLTSIVLPNTLTSIGDTIFYGCNNLSAITIPNNIAAITAYMFFNCSSMTSISLPNTITSIGDGAFCGCGNLTSITFPITINSIGACAFQECTSLTSINIPNSATTIGNMAFFGCSDLDSVTIGTSVSSIGIAAFRDCTSLQNVTLLPQNPPLLGNDAVFGNNAINRKFIIPCGSLSTYQNASGWSDYSGSIHDPFVDLELTVSSDNSTMGIVSIATPSEYDVACDSSAVIQATANYGYHFDRWSNGNTSNPSTIQLVSDTLITAFFAKNYYTVSVEPNHSDRGVVDGGATVEYLDNITISATANYGYHFAQWDDGNISNPRIVQVTQNKVYTAVFDNNQYSISLNVDDVAQGLCNGGGSYNYLSSQTIIAVPSHGYHFTHWDDGDTNNPRVIILTQDTTFIASFAKNTYTISCHSTDSIKGNVTGGESMEYLDTVTISATPNYGYHFSYWSDGDTNNPRLIIVTDNQTYYAYFGYNPYTIEVDADTTYGNCTGGGIYNYLSQCTIAVQPYYGYSFSMWNDGDTNNPRVVNLTQDTIFTAMFTTNQYSLTLQGNDESIGSVEGDGIYDYLDTVTITATAIEHHHFVCWSDGNTDNPRQYVITDDAVITAIFAIDTHNVNITTNDIARGMVTVQGSNFVYGTPCTVTATAYTGYSFAGWSNGVTANPYTFAVLCDVELTALFVAEGENVYTITVESADPMMGNVNGGGLALDGGSITIQAFSNPGYHFSHWSDNSTDSIRTIEVHGNLAFTAYFTANVGITDVDSNNIRVFSRDKQILIEGANGMKIWVFDMMGRAIYNGKTPIIPIQQTGVYIVKVGNNPARKVVVMR